MIKILISYLILAYVYFCPRDPSQNPLVCQHLAELHWKLEPHLHSLHLKLTQPILQNTQTQLKPIYDEYLLPTYLQLQPHLSTLSSTLNDWIQTSTLTSYALQFQTQSLQPILSKVQTQLSQIILPHLSSITQDTFQTLQRSKFIHFIRSSLILPCQDTLMPFIIKTFDAHLPTFTQPFQHISHTIRGWYRITLLRSWIRFDSVYVRPQLNKIASKLEEYRHRKQSLHAEQPLTQERSEDPLKPNRVEDHSAQDHHSLGDEKKKGWADAETGSHPPISIHEPDSMKIQEPLIFKNEPEVMEMDERTDVEEEPLVVVHQEPEVIAIREEAIEIQEPDLIVKEDPIPITIQEPEVMAIKEEDLHQIATEPINLSSRPRTRSRDQENDPAEGWRPDGEEHEEGLIGDLDGERA